MEGTDYEGGHIHMSSVAIPSEENRDAVRRFYEEVFDQGNLEVAYDIFADEYVLHDRDQDPGGDVHGPAGIAKFVESFRECFSELQVSNIGNPMAAEGNRVVTRFMVRGIFGDAADRSVSDDFQRTPVEWEGMSISQFSEEGKITESWSYWESGRMYEQLGYFAVRWKRPPR
jgi:predicted SnoaL-like aldol condensation-catalyzing enzyme